MRFFSNWMNELIFDPGFINNLVYIFCTCGYVFSIILEMLKPCIAIIRVDWCEEIISFPSRIANDPFSFDYSIIQA
jgi:hypothetical protein